MRIEEVKRVDRHICVSRQDVEFLLKENYMLNARKTQQALEHGCLLKK